MVRPTNTDTTNVSISKILLDRFWEIFYNLDTRRIKSFFHLYYFIAIVLLITFNEKGLQTDLFNLNYDQVVFVSPLIIAILFVRYLILSAYSLNTQQKHNKYFEFYREKLAEVYEEPKTLDEFKEYEMSEIPNIFMFPIEIDASKKLCHLFHYLSFFVFNALILLINIVIPLLYYSKLTYLDFSQIQNSDPYKFLGIIYCITGPLLIILFFYLIYKTNTPRSYLKGKNNSNNTV